MSSMTVLGLELVRQVRKPADVGEMLPAMRTYVAEQLAAGRLVWIVRDPHADGDERVLVTNNRNGVAV